MLQLCETRLDNIVFRLGIAPTRRGARQLVSHKHILLNGSICNVPSALLKVGDEIEVRERSKSLEIIKSSLTNNTQSHDWLDWNGDLMKGIVKTVPDRSQISENIKEQLIVELYSK